MKMVVQICESTLHTTHIDALKKTIPYLIAKWIQNNYAINSFPWYFTRSESHNDFLLDENECIAVAVLRHAPNLLSEYVQMMQAESLESILRGHEVRRFKFDFCFFATIYLFFPDNRNQLLGLYHSTARH